LALPESGFFIVAKIPFPAFSDCKNLPQYLGLKSSASDFLVVVLVSGCRFGPRILSFEVSRRLLRRFAGVELHEV
jgi:hypothetical protein